MLKSETIRKWLKTFATGPSLKLLPLAFWFTSSLTALPQGFQAVDGNVNPPFVDPNGVFIVESQDRAVIDWTSFSIGAGEFVYFDQGGASPAILNRVVGTEVSNLFGQLNSNGEIYLLNQNGVLIGPSGYIQTAGFVCSTFDIMNQAFMDNGPLVFQGNSTNTFNNDRGIVYCPTGDILIAAYEAKSSGVLNAPMGTVTIISGQQPFYVQTKQSNHLFLRMASTDAPKKEVEAKMISVRGDQVFLTP